MLMQYYGMVEADIEPMSQWSPEDVQAHIEFQQALNQALTGFRVVDVDSAARADEIAAQTSAAPGPDGVPIRQAIEVRQIMSAPDPEM